MPTSGRAKLRRFFSRTNLLFILLCSSVAIAGIVAINDLSIYTPDSTRYLVWAKSIALFNIYKDATLPDPARYVVHAPLYSALLTPVARFFPDNIVAAKLFTFSLGLLALLFFYRWLLRKTEKKTALIASVLLAVNPLYFLYSTEVLSDIPFAAAFILFFLMMEEMAETVQVKTSRLIILASVITAGILLREIGFSMLASGTIFFLMKKRWKEAAAVCIIPITVYAVWYVRNEIVVAAFETPALTNAKLFTHHFFSLPGDSLVHELIARIWNNIGVYGKGVGKLLFFPFYSWLQYDVVFLERTPLTQLYALLDIIKYPMMIFTIGLSGYGVFVDVKSSPTALLRIMFFFCYILIVLLYPVNDIRFIIPMMVLMIYYTAISLNVLSWNILAPIILLMMLPNLLWEYQYIDNCRAYNASPVNFYNTTVGLKKYPSHFTKPFRLVGEWMQAHTASSTVILSQWKDLVCWVDDRKVYPTDQTIPLDEFEHLIRDYDIRYLVSMIQKNGIHEFEFQMHQSHRYEFIPAHRIANLEIIEIREKRIPLPSSDTSTAFRKGITFLNQQRYTEAESVFRDARANDSLNLPLLFYSSVADEFGMKLDDAASRFASIGSLPQSLMYLEESAIHQQMIATLKEIKENPVKETRGARWYTLAGQCWNLGYRAQAQSFIRTSVEEDSLLLPAMFLGIHMALQQGDTLEAKRYIARASNVQPDHPAVRVFEQLFRQLDSLRELSDDKLRSQQYLLISKTYGSIGIVEAAIDNALLALKENPNSIEALSALAEMYRVKRRYAPALRMLRMMTTLDPHNTLLDKQFEEVSTHF